MPKNSAIPRHLMLMFTLLLTGCAVVPDQSMLHPAGPAAAKIAWLWWIMLGAFTAVFVLVLGLLGRAILHGPEKQAGPSAANGAAPPLGRTGFIVAGGVLLPILVLTPLFIVTLNTAAALRAPAEGLTIRVVGHMWWWEVRYPGHDIVTANEIHIPAGRPVRLKLGSVDVIHSFWVPRLNGKRDLIPGMENELWIEADEPGIYRGQCGEYCGTQHANMAFLVIALPPDDFEAWLAAQTKPRPEPTTGVERRGQHVYMTAGCAQCHAIRGTPAIGNVGPDLTHMGSRRTIGAATLPNTRSNLSNWIADPQAIKPGVKMPRTPLMPDDLLAVTTYLEGLK